MAVTYSLELMGMDGNCTVSPVREWQQHMPATKLDVPLT